ncbi:hypothetical protein PVAG01_01181 [Phlyctema vagabunda]|uniref:Uncharacterized protein n=1 Tax=Phlyctema vagabunda TaxID=108571 RepID=A0ABR4PWX8_9HELO
MDEAYNQHAPHTRRNRSSASLNHLTLAPLTSKLPLSDHDALPEPKHHVSYIEGRSAPTTPSVLSRSSSRVSLLKPMSATLPKSKSSTHLVARKQPRSGATTPGGTKTRRHHRDDLTLSARDRNDSDWLLRTSALISSSTQESKGQSWLVSRQSSTSLHRDEDEEALERDLAREREQTSRRESRRGSTAAAFDADDEFSPVTRRSFSFGPGSRPFSQPASRFASRRGSKAQALTPMERNQSGYFDLKYMQEEELPAEPDFVDVEEDGYEDAETGQDDEAVVRKLARANSLGLGGWVERMLGWNLFAVDEDGEETEADTLDEKSDEHEKLSRSSSRRNLDGVDDTPVDEQMPALKPDDAGGWNDAAWLLSVATKVLL